MKTKSNIAKKAGKEFGSVLFFGNNLRTHSIPKAQESDLFFEPNSIQPKLNVGQLKDKYEQGVDSVIGKHMPSPQIQRQPAGYPGTVEKSENYDIDYDKAKELNEAYQNIFWGKLLGKVKHGLFLEWEEIWNRGDLNGFANKVASYQWLRGLKVDGALGAETWKRISDLPFIYKWKTFTATGSQTKADNNCALCPQRLGVDTRFYNRGGYGPALMGSTTNGIELRAFISNHDAGYTYDIKRTIERANWERTGAGPWNLTDNKPAGTSDDPNDLDEHPTPGNPPIPTPPGTGPSTDLYHIYSTDQPGFKPHGILISPTSTEAVKKATFTEYVEIIDPAGNKRKDDHTWDWHSTTWMVKAGINWIVNAANSEIGDGSQTVGTTGP